MIPCWLLCNDAKLSQWAAWDFPIFKLHNVLG
jgi:hypothetical protein